ncbi:MAG: DUF2721 domain-containing protein, partial [Chitinophagaceae bacterium]
ALKQIKHFRTRLRYIRFMKGAGVFSFLLCVIFMYAFYEGWMVFAKFVIAGSLLSLLFSLICSFIEIYLSLEALEVVLKDVED